MAVEDKESERSTHQEPERGPEVEVTVDTLKKTVHRGSWIVSDFKKTVGVDANRELDEVIGGEFRELKDDQRITIKGGEIFVSHVRKGGSS